MLKILEAVIDVLEEDDLRADESSKRNEDSVNAKEW